jgi:hypothetical protein
VLLQILAIRLTASIGGGYYRRTTMSRDAVVESAKEFYRATWDNDTTGTELIRRITRHGMAIPSMMADFAIAETNLLTEEVSRLKAEVERLQDLLAAVTH